MTPLSLALSVVLAFTALPSSATAVVAVPQREDIPYLSCPCYDRELIPGGIAAPEQYPDHGRPLAGMVPHHLLAADMIAGFLSLAAPYRDSYETVVIVSPSHFPENCGSDVVTSGWDWDTPYGAVKTDGAVVGAFLGNGGIGAEDNPAAVEADHGAAGLIPFVRYYLPGTKAAVLLLSNKLDRQRLAAVWAQVEELSAGGRVLVVASADCSHYLAPDDAVLRDAETAAAIEAMDYRRILAFGDANVDSPQALTTFLKAGKAAGGALRQLDHSSSAEKIPQALSNPVYQEGITSYFVYGAFLDEEGAPR